MIAKLQLFIIVVALSLVATACGSDSGSKDGAGVSGESAEQLISRAKSQLTSENTVTIRGAGTDGGSKVKLNVTYAGRTTAGTVSMDGGRIRLLKTKGRAYFKGGDAFYEQAAGANASQFKQVVAGRWILIDPKNKDFAGLEAFTDRKKFLGGLAQQLKGNFSKGKQGRIAGIECISLKDASGTAWLDIRNGNLLRLVTNDGQALNFSYRRVRPAKPPQPDDVFDLASLS